MNLRQYTKADIGGKQVLLRLDLDVQVNKQGEVDRWHDLRLERAVPTIKNLLQAGAERIVLAGHRGRPAARDEKFSLRPVAARLQTLLREQGISEPIKFADDVAAVADAGKGGLVMLENLRFWPGEKTSDKSFARTLAQWGEVYINDAFGASHRSDASMRAIIEYNKAAFAGPNLLREIEQLSEFARVGERPFLAVVGGLKIETKLPLLKFLLEKADEILLGGGLANTFLRSRGTEIGASALDSAHVDAAKEVYSDKIILPKDAVVVNPPAGGDGQTRIVPIDAVAGDDFIGDIGPETIKFYQEKLSSAKKILFNGPLGKFEKDVFQAGTAAIVRAITGSNALTLSGGGDTIDILERLEATAKFSFVSVGGGAMLTFLAGGEMPALEALRISNF